MQGGSIFDKSAFSGELANVEDGLEHIAETWGADLLDREVIPNPLPETSTPVFIRPWSLDPAD